MVVRKLFLHEGSKVCYPERLCSLCPLVFLNPDWTKLWATWPDHALSKQLDWPSLEHEVDSVPMTVIKQEQAHCRLVCQIILIFPQIKVRTPHSWNILPHYKILAILESIWSPSSWGRWTLARCQVSTKLFYHSPSSSRQGENNIEKLLVNHSDLIKEKTKFMHMRAEENHRLLYLFSISTRSPTTSQEARFQHTQWLLWKINIINNECLPFLLSSLRFYIWADTLWSGITLWLFQVSFPGFVTS